MSGVWGISLIGPGLVGRFPLKAGMTRLAILVSGKGPWIECLLWVGIFFFGVV